MWGCMSSPHNCSRNLWRSYITVPLLLDCWMHRITPSSLAGGSKRRYYLITFTSTQRPNFIFLFSLVHSWCLKATHSISSISKAPLPPFLDDTEHSTLCLIMVSLMMNLRPIIRNYSVMVFSIIRNGFFLYFERWMYQICHPSGFSVYFSHWFDIWRGFKLVMNVS